MRYATALTQAYNWLTRPGRGPMAHYLAVFTTDPEAPSLIRKACPGVEEITRPARYFMVALNRGCRETHEVPSP